jgi:hypothetical protein
LFVCFAGSKFFKHIVFFVGFIAGSMLGYYLVGVIWGWFGSKMDLETRLYIGMTLGAMVGIGCVMVYKVAVFTVGAVGGVIAGQLVFQFATIITKIPHAIVVQVCLLILGAVLGGYLAHKFVSFILKGVTAFIGAFMFASGLAYFVQKAQGKDGTNVIGFANFFANKKKVKSLRSECDSYCFLCLSVWILFTFAGAYVQYRLHKRHNRKDFDDELSESYEDSYSDEDSYSYSYSDEPKKKQKQKKVKKGKKSPAGDLEMVPSKSPRRSERGGAGRYDEARAAADFDKMHRGYFTERAPAGRPPPPSGPRPGPPAGPGRYSMYDEGPRGGGGGGYAGGTGEHYGGRYGGGPGRAQTSRW